MSTGMFNDEFIDMLAGRVAEKLRTGGKLSASIEAPWQVGELAEKLGVSKATIYTRVRAGLITEVPEMGRVLIPFTEVQRLLAGRVK